LVLCNLCSDLEKQAEEQEEIDDDDDESDDDVMISIGKVNPNVPYINATVCIIIIV